MKENVAKRFSIVEKAPAQYGNNISLIEECPRSISAHLQKGAFKNNFWANENTTMQDAKTFRLEHF